MPAINEKRSVLNNRGIVGSWANGSSAGKYFYREKVPGKKAYRFYKLDEAKNLDEAEAMAANAAIELGKTAKEEIVNTNQPTKLTLIEREERILRRKERLLNQEIATTYKGIGIQEAIEGWLEKEMDRVRSGFLQESSYLHKYYCFKHVQKYLEDKGVTRTSQIVSSTFDDYLLFRSGTTRILLAREVVVIREWFKKYLVKFNHMDLNVYLKGGFLPTVKVRDSDRMANPAINPDDWREIVRYVRNEWRHEADEVNYTAQRRTRQYFRNLFWHYILVAKNSGMSPEELLKLKWKNVEIRDVGRISQTKAELEIEELEAEGIDVIGEDTYKAGDWAPNPNAFGREERLIAYISTVRQKTQEAREIPTNLGGVFKRWKDWQESFLKMHEMDITITPDDYVFGNPMNEGKPAHQNRIGYNWRYIIKHLTAKKKLKGHKFSDKPYTLYSMRSTFIEDHLRKGTDIFLVARMAGHDVKTLQQTYERLDIRHRTKEITDIEYGKRKEDVELYNLFK
tara:strand:+ start:1665 stop:3194 length:1530 start_codon:yes stop_codon:yes gene_type:complete